MTELPAVERVRARAGTHNRGRRLGHTRRVPDSLTWCHRHLETHARVRPRRCGLSCLTVSLM